jgi:hypothetical protein
MTIFSDPVGHGCQDAAACANRGGIGQTSGASPNMTVQVAITGHWPQGLQPVKTERAHSMPGPTRAALTVSKS